MRPFQWVKNIILFLPMFFAQEIGDTDRLWNVAILFAGFCLLTSGVYIFNDLMDAGEDRLHPVKRFRPIASRKVSPMAALVFMFLLYATSALCFSFMYTSNNQIWLLSGGYILLNLAYTLYLKQVQIIDAMILSFLSSIIAVTYILYTLSPEVTSRSSEYLYATVPFVLAGIMRYLQIILVEKSNCNPTDILLQDRTLQLTVAGWFIVFALLIY